MKRKNNEYEDALTVDEILSLHQEKRTALKSVRIGIAMVAIQASLLGVMVVSTSSPAHMASHWVVPLLAINVLFFLLSACCIAYPLIRIHRLDQKIRTRRDFLKTLGC